MSPIHFSGSSYRFGDIILFNLLPPKSWSKSRNAIFTNTQFDGKCQSLQTSVFAFFISVMVWPMRTIFTDRHTHTHTQTDRRTQTDKPMAIVEILHVCLKMCNTVFAYFNICHWIVPLRKFYSVTLTYFSRSNMSNVNISKTLRTGAKKSNTTLIDFYFYRRMKRWQKSSSVTLNFVLRSKIQKGH